MIKGLILILIINAGSEKIKVSLKKVMENKREDEKIGVIVHLNEKPDYEMIKNLSPKEYVEFLKSFCESSQNKIISNLKNKFSNKISKLNSFWIFNGFYLETTKEVIEFLANKEEVEYITLDSKIKTKDFKPGAQISLVEWNILNVKADSCWMAGYTGEGIIIGHLDTGVDINHPALQGKWLSPYWYDAINQQPTPYDDNGHGTHTMGIILGGDGLGPFQDDIGVAPSAKFVACKVLDSTGTFQMSWIYCGIQKLVDWKGQGINIRVVSGSWSSDSTTFLDLWNAILGLRNVDIIPVFEIGDYGPDSGTAGTPGNYPILIGVGATDENDYVALFSARGPAPDTPPWNGALKPDLCAPGVNIRSSIPGGGYAVYSGTGMATPHVAGGIAIILQKCPYLSFSEIYNVLTQYAKRPSHGAPYPNNSYGWGILDIYQALLHACSEVSEPPKNLIPLNFYKNAHIEIYEVNGRCIKVLNNMILKNENIILKNLKSGVYFITFKNKGKEKNLKRIKIK